ncbi:MAG: hypothetical protein ACFCU4_03110 [Puniceicoccaceae bacterium]
MDLLSRVLILLYVTALAMSLYVRSLKLRVLRRWLGWIALVVLLGIGLHASALLDRDLLVCLSIAGLGLLLVETVYHWTLVRALSRSDWPLFPRFMEAQENEGWPKEELLLRWRQQLEERGYRTISILVSPVFPQFVVRMYVMESSDRKVRLNLLCLPQGKKSPRCFLSFISISKEGHRFLTDNVALPYGGYYPTHWQIERHPWTESILRLEERHRTRLESAQTEFEEMVEEPVAEVNDTQEELEMFNRKQGFLRAYDEQTPDRISPEGRYRIWKEILLVNYFGRTLYG